MTQKNLISKSPDKIPKLSQIKLNESQWTINGLDLIKFQGSSQLTVTSFYLSNFRPVGLIIPPSCHRVPHLPYNHQHRHPSYPHSTLWGCTGTYAVCNRRRKRVDGERLWGSPEWRHLVKYTKSRHFGTHPSAMLASSQLCSANLLLDSRRIWTLSFRSNLVLIHVFVYQCED